jgi:hypothetical protein
VKRDETGGMGLDRNEGWHSPLKKERGMPTSILKPATELAE